MKSTGRPRERALGWRRSPGTGPHDAGVTVALSSAHARATATHAYTRTAPRRRGQRPGRRRFVGRVGVGRWRFLFGENSHGGTAKYPTAKQTRRTPGENPDEGATVVREARWEQQGLDKELRTPVRGPQAGRGSRPGGDPGCEVQWDGTEADRSQPCLPPRPAELPDTWFRDSASEETQPKQAPLRPAPPRVLQLPGGASWLCACTAGRSPRLLHGSTWAKGSPAGKTADTSQSERHVKP